MGLCGVGAALMRRAKPLDAASEPTPTPLDEQKLVETSQTDASAAADAFQPLPTTAKTDVLRPGTPDRAETEATELLTDKKIPMLTRVRFA
jgi:hypothetical protein